MDCGPVADAREGQISISLSKSSPTTTDGIQINDRGLRMAAESFLGKIQISDFYPFLIACLMFACLHSWFKGFILFYKLL